MKEIFDIFGLSGKVEQLDGGQGKSVRVGDFVVKPIEEIGKYSWVGSVLEPLDFRDLYLSKPIRSKLENFVEQGFGVTQYIEGQFEVGRLEEKLTVCNQLNEIIQLIEKPEEWYSWSSPWQQATQMAWNNMSFTDTTDIKSLKLIESLKDHYQTISLDTQLIHSDISGNILFNDQHPVIIDFSPEFRSRKYSEALLVTDSIAWYQEPLASIYAIPYEWELVVQLAIRAIVFRVSVAIILNPTNYKAVLKELKNFELLLSFLNLKYIL